MTDSTDPPKDATTYGRFSLDWWKRTGAAHIEFWCVGGQVYGRRCTHRHAVPIDDLIARAGPGTTLVMLARRARCAACGKLGCHVQPSEPPVTGQPGYREWLREEMYRCQSFLAWAREQF